MICIYRDRILRDVANLAYVAADIRTDRYKPHELHQTFDICEGENLERVDHIIAIATEELRVLLHDETIRLLPQAPPTPAAITLAALYAHEYVVARVLADWFSITLPEAAKAWQEKLQDLSSRLKLSAPSFTVGSRPIPPI